MPEIRNAVAQDETGIAALWRACGLTVSYNDPAEDFRFALNGACSTILVAQDMQLRIAGSVMVGHDGHRGWLYYVAVRPDLQGQGLGTKLVRAAEEWLQARAVRKVQLLVRSSNREVMGFYEQLGYADAPVAMMSRWLTPQ